MAQLLILNILHDLRMQQCHNSQGMKYLRSCKKTSIHYALSNPEAYWRHVCSLLDIQYHKSIGRLADGLKGGLLGLTATQNSACKLVQACAICCGRCESRQAPPMSQSVLPSCSTPTATPTAVNKPSSSASLWWYFLAMKGEKGARTRLGSVCSRQ